MKVILRANVEGVGHTGDLGDVANGYAQNFLMPKGLAMRATEGAATQAEAMQLAARWGVLVAALAGAAVLNLDVDDATLALEANDATDIDAYVASLSLPRLEGAGCAANDAPCVRKVVADALRAAVEDEAPPAPLRCEANATAGVRLAPTR